MLRSNKSRAEKFARCQKKLGINVNHVDMAGQKSSHERILGRRKDRLGVVNATMC